MLTTAAEAMWTAAIEPDFAWAGGFVVALKDGRRVYVSGDATPFTTRTVKPARGKTSLRRK